jgi:type I restriction enzyme M protein
MLNSQLRNEIDKVWDTFASGGLTNPMSVIEQITYLLFIRRLDELQTLKESKASVLGKTIEKPIYTSEQSNLRWSRFKDMDPEAMYSLFRKENGVFDFIRNLAGKDSAFGRFMKDAVFTIPTARLLSNVVDMLDGIDMKDRDTKGDLYEYLLSKLSTAGRAGQFRTPRHIIKMMVEMMQPTADDIICDPAAGTCGFLVAASEYFREKHPTLFYEEKFSEHFSNSMFMGMEFDPHMIRVGAMNMILHGIENPQLKDVDSLSEANNDFIEKASLILANPPFAGTLDHDAVDGSLLKVVRTKVTELLFLALILRGLKKGGRAAVIVPEGVVFGTQKAHIQIRKELVETNRLEAVISIPAGVFKPYAGVSTAILIFTKTGNGGTDNVWFYDMEGDGFSLDDKRQPFKKTGVDGGMIFPDDYGDVKDILERWKNRSTEQKRGRTEQSFMVPLKEIRDNNYYLGINKYSELVHEEKVFDAPEAIILEIKQLDNERKNALQMLEELLK